MWKSAKSVIENSEFVIGRMYRKFLASRKVRIRLCAFDADNPAELTIDKLALPNDPMYLMAKTSCPEPFAETPMFELWGEPATVQIQHRGRQHNVKVTFSVAKSEARQGTNPGSLPHGRHAARNVGVSVVRAGRELDLEQSWVNSYDPTERWWGVQVDFSPGLDEVFGVANNKQSARNFHEIEVDSLLLPGETVAQLKERLLEDDDPFGPLLELSELIGRNLSAIRKLLGAQTKGERRNRQRHLDQKAEKIATDQTRIRKEEGHAGESDSSENLPDTVRTEQIEDALLSVGLTEGAAHGIAASTVDSGLKYTIVDAALESAAFFSVTLKGGTVIVTLNTTHAAYAKLVEVLEEVGDNEDLAHLRARLGRARDGLRLLLLAWSRYEDELSGARRIQAQDARVDWGRIARQFLEG
jgi:hypothetical protein